MQRARRLHKGLGNWRTSFCHIVIRSRFIFSKDNVRLGTKKLLWLVKSVCLLEKKMQTRLIWWDVELQEQLVTTFLVSDSHRHSIMLRKTTDNIFSRMQNRREELTLPKVDSYISSPVLDSMLWLVRCPRSIWISNLPVSISNEEILFSLILVYSHWVQQTFSGIADFPIILHYTQNGRIWSYALLPFRL